MARPSKAQLWAGAAAVALVAVWAWQHFGLGALLTLDTLEASRDALQAQVQTQSLATAAVFFAVYVAAAAQSIPGAVILALAAGAMFGLGWGLLLVSFASSLGALLAFLVARDLLRDGIQARFGKALAPIDEGVRKDGTLYLMKLRLVPVFPFWLINLLKGLTPLGAGRFYVVSQFGMLAGTAVYVNAGTQLAALQSPGDILSPGLLGSFVLLGLFPLLAKAGVAWLARRKALIRSAKMARQPKKAHGLGVADAAGRVDFAAVMRRAHGVIRDIEPHDSIERDTGLGVEVQQGHARITSPWTVEVKRADGTTQTLTTRNIVIAAGASPFVPPIPGLKEAGSRTSDTVWGPTELPRRLVVLGGGPIGSELAQGFARLGSAVTQVEMAPRIMLREDPEVSELVAASLRADGVNVLTGHQAVRVEMVDGEKRLIAKAGGAEVVIPVDELLCAVGRSPRVTGYGLEELGIPLTPRKTIETNANLQTLYPNICAVGDVAGPFQFTHTAAHQAWYAAVNALFGRFRRFKADHRVIPWATFTDPEVARVGLSESEAKAQGVDHEVTTYGIDDLDRAIADGTAHGFVKVLTVPGKDRILGVTIVGKHAGDVLAEYVLAMKHGLGLNKILGTIHTDPTLAAANKYVAGQCKRAHAPQKLLQWVGRHHAWGPA
jgi:pyruvate/2-oxoglutarate dehydrogenase complex dihydrolipoamide dehydrogenase (E3) component/uncharacterized membrane protein YdjX (TVP38/TMEM64 family)